ncbi:MULTISPECIES: lipoprotein-releasing ABC transporter permease subunit [Halocynthiibacter]|uniref:Lipoprotein-releasing ABC transporter permease subunit n=1 Tax=Halocynthiibacter halioticoli TaxID=2986804 RepID=A0AAE3LSQ5_9RHOB|nr:MULTISPECIES: lipoprotein-releasing ABC transporter permease subunit [Halocynthiibacter]MCV6823796.1 lipoprotein-releasing ABC transporter permease subunit [Halocynthiibacter halioticoli]MCW4056797.1 lipoprotein-releasing ABC transporter permease subunit [Halocynthiibacter sp. SDUM655004]
MQEPEVVNQTAPFSRFEWLIAWRYLRARRADGGVSVMTWISLIGIMLAVAALIITLAVRAGFRAEFVDTILGANAHVTIYNSAALNEGGQPSRVIEDYTERAEAIRQVPGVIRVAPLVKGQVMTNHGQQNAFAQVFGIARDDLAAIPRIANPETADGDLADFDRGIAVGREVARTLGVGLGDTIKLISPNGAKTAFGTSPRVNAYEVTYIFTAGRYDIDNTRIYMPFTEAQSYFNREGVADELEVMVAEPESVRDLTIPLLEAGGDRTMIWTWQDASGGFLRALEIEDNVMFVLMSVLVLVASLNIISGLVMLVKNKGRDIGILRTMGLTEGAVMRVFFICGALVGVIGTIFGVIAGCLFAIYFDQILAIVNGASGGDVWDASVRGIYKLPAKLELSDVLVSVALSLFLSFVVTIFPARRAARMNPVEALRYE